MTLLLDYPPHPTAQPEQGEEGAVPGPLAGLRILVVGASSGIGAAVARRGAEQDAHVVVAARRGDALAKLAGPHDHVHPMGLDVRDQASVRAGVQAAVDALGGLDAVVYTAGTSPLVPMADATAEDWRDVLDTNVVGCAHVAMAAAPHLLASEGRLVVLSSKAVRQPFADLGLYSTSKVALDGLLRCLPVEVPGLRVSRVVVGNTHDTDFATGWDPQRFGASLERWAAQGVLGSTRTMAPDEVADAILMVVASPVHIDDIAVLEHPPTVDPAEDLPAGGPR